jgi:hypothetical protein
VDLMKEKPIFQKGTHKSQTTKEKVKKNAKK